MPTRTKKTGPASTQQSTQRGVTLVNPSTTAMVYSDDGHLLGAGEAVELAALDTTGRHAVNSGYLTVREPADTATAPSASPAADGDATPGDAPAETGGDSDGPSARRAGSDPA